MSDTLQPAKFIFLTRLGDTALVLSHRLSEWCGKGPALEEDMALANVALDLLGQARLWLSYAGDLENAGRDEDALAYGRNDREYRNLLLAERPNGSYADTVMRQFFFDAFHALQLDALARSADERVAEIAAKAAKEVAYHVRRSADLVVRLGDGTAESRARMQAAADALWPYTGEMFAEDAVDAAMADAGVAVLPSTLRAAWTATVERVFAQATLRMPPHDAWMQRGGRDGVHSEHLGFLLAEMQVLPRAFPGAAW